MKVVGYKDADGNAVTEADAVAQGHPPLGTELKLQGQEFKRVVVDEAATFPALGELPVHPTKDDCPAHDSRCTDGVCVAKTLPGPRGISSAELADAVKAWVPPSALGPSRYDGDERLDGRTPGMLTGVRVPSSEVAAKQEAWLRESQRRIDEHEAFQRRHAFKARRFSTLTDAEVKEVMAYDLTPAARKALDKVNPTVSEAQTLKGSDVLLFNALAGDGPVEQLRPPPVPVPQQEGFKPGVLCGLLVGSGVTSALPYIVEALKGWFQ